MPGTTRVGALDSLLSRRQAILDTLKVHLVATQARMKTQADRHRQERSFVVGDWVFLRLQPTDSSHWLPKASGSYLQDILGHFRY